MGIPSYFKHILDRYRQLLRPATGFLSNVLLVDFNCLIYGCVRGPTMPAYSHATKDLWEAALLKNIKEYVVTIWNVSGKPAEVYLAVDGVVPMAKIRQQRLRRFKSVWLTEKERELGARANAEEVWDTNSITPGTAFMEKLTVELQGLCKARTGWMVSGAEEEGEGEQKLMTWIRSRPVEWFSNKQIYVYGLDADLIVLSMFHAGVGKGSGAQWSILREKQEFGKFASGTNDPFVLLNITKMVQILFPDSTTREAYLYDYVAGMCLLGNDFVPHSLGINIREGGHDRLQDALTTLHAEGGTLLKLVDGKHVWDKAGLLMIIGNWALTEPTDILSSFKQKYRMRGMTPRTDAEWKMLPVQNLPLTWADEKRLWNTRDLLDGWTHQYYMEGTRNICLSDIQKRCEQYCVGLQWIIDYYTGQGAGREWMYAWTYPPLWSDLVDYVKVSKALPSPPILPEIPLQPQEQLSLVLPLESWSLIRNPRLRGIPALAPAFWPRKFDFMSLGKRMMWECPPRIPILTPARLRLLLV